MSQKQSTSKVVDVFKDAGKSSEFDDRLQYVEDELKATIARIDGEIEKINTTTRDLNKFVFGVYNAKSTLFELRINALKQIASLAVDKKRLSDDTGGNVRDITDLLVAAGKK